jgi:hypothetical protein
MLALSKDDTIHIYVAQEVGDYRQNF